MGLAKGSKDVARRGSKKVIDRNFDEKESWEWESTSSKTS